MNGDNGLYRNTPIQTVTAAGDALKKDSASEKWLIVLTDGEFDRGTAGSGIGSSETQSTITGYAGKDDINVAYVAIGSSALSLKSVSADGFYPFNADTNNILSSAGDLMRFRAPEGKDTRGGEYYAAYIETIRQLGPDTNTNAVLTPHLDKHWHLPKYLPDLDDRNQAILETEIYTALAWGMLTGKIEQNLARGEYSSADSSMNITYRPATKKSDDFVVPNGTPCDDLYEVVDQDNQTV